MKYQKGFTLVEVIVVAALMGFMSLVLIRNFGQSRLDLNEAANIVLADVRAMQTKVISGTQYSNQIRCGYGLERNSTTTYRLYAGPTPSANNTNCTSYDRNYNSSGAIGSRDVQIELKNLKDNNRLEFKTTFNDIYFEPIEPKVFINSSFVLTNPAERITIGIIGQACTATNCRSICVYPSGRVELRNGASCP